VKAADQPVEVVLLAAASPDVAFVLGSRLSLASASSVIASASRSRVIASIRRDKLDVLHAVATGSHIETAQLGDEAGALPRLSCATPSRSELGDLENCAQ
jgi:hypothetical protein